MNELDLSGTWRATAAAAGANDFNSLDHDDSSWVSIDVPSHWATESALANVEGSVLYRRHFEASASSGQRSWINFGGIFTHGSVWVDGTYAGDVDGYFAERAFEITSALAARKEHVVAVEVNAPSFDVPWSAPGGIWKPVTIQQSGAVRIARMKILCTEAREERAVLSCYVELDSQENIEVQVQTRATPALSTSHAGTDHHTTHKLAAGANRLHWHVTVEQPDLWWPWSLGNQPFFDVSIEVIDSRTPHQISDHQSVRTGLRQLSFDNGYTFVNGERIFLESIESGNDGTPPIDTDHSYFTELIQKPKEAGANLLVRSRWVEPSPFYDVADQLGMLVWQGVPSNNEKTPHARHARQMVEVLGHHPSVALWLRPMKRLRDKRPTPDALKRTLDQSDTSRVNIEHPTGWDLKRLSQRDLLAIVPKWAKRSRFLYFTSDPRESGSHIEALRLLKYRPLGGFIAPLALPELLNGACNPVRLIAVPKELHGDEETEIDVFVVNDTRAAISGAVVRVEVGEKSWSWTGDVDSDAFSFVGTASVIRPQSGQFEMQLHMEGIPSRTVVFN